jgi:hypothetical protein
MVKHINAPGPWRTELIRNSIYIKSEHKTDRNLSICRVSRHRYANNIPLLVSAPELLDVCEELLGFAMISADIEGSLVERDMIEKAVYVISKAKGA